MSTKKASQVCSRDAGSEYLDGDLIRDLREDIEACIAAWSAKVARHAGRSKATIDALVHHTLCRIYVSTLRPVGFWEPFLPGSLGWQFQSLEKVDASAYWQLIADFECGMRALYNQAKPGASELAEGQPDFDFPPAADCDIVEFRPWLMLSSPRDK